MPTLRPHERLVGTHDAFHVNNAKQCSLQPSDNGHGHTWPAKGTLFGTIAGAHTMYSYRVLFLKTNTPRDGARHKERTCYSRHPRGTTLQVACGAPRLALRLVT